MRVSEKKREAWNGRKILAYAEKGDLVCREEVERMAYALSDGIITLSYVLNPHVIILGGGVMENSNLFTLVKDKYYERMNPLLTKNCRIEKAHFGNNAGCLGALIHFLRIEGISV